MNGAVVSRLLALMLLRLGPQWRCSDQWVSGEAQKRRGADAIGACYPVEAKPIGQLLGANRAARRPVIQLRGLTNEGSTCFAAAAVQLLVRCRPLLEDCRTLLTSEEHAGRHKERWPLTRWLLHLVGLFEQGSFEGPLQFPLHGLAPPGAERWFDDGCQQDATEFFTWILCQLHEECPLVTPLLPWATTVLDGGLTLRCSAAAMAMGLILADSAGAATFQWLVQLHAGELAGQTIAEAASSSLARLSVLHLRPCIGVAVNWVEEGEPASGSLVRAPVPEIGDRFTARGYGAEEDRVVGALAWLEWDGPDPSRGHYRACVAHNGCWWAVDDH